MSGRAGVLFERNDLNDEIVSQASAWPSVYPEAVVQVSAVLSKSEKGMKILELRETLRVSIQTLLRWLSSMERAGIIYRTFERAEKRGRPKSVYHLRKEIFWEEEDASDSIRIITDPKQILEKRLHFADSAMTRLDSCADSSAPALSIGSQRFIQTIADTIARGVRFRYITDIVEDNIEHCEKLLQLGVDVRHINGIRANFAVTDGEYHAAIFFGETRRSPQLFFSKKASVVIGYQRIFEELWEKAVPLRQRIRDFEKSSSKKQKGLADKPVNSAESSSSIFFSFPKLSALCKFQSGKRCLVKPDLNGPCNQYSCPFLVT